MADLTIDERFEAKKQREDNASYNNAVSLIATTQQPASYGKWVQVTYTDSLKSVVNRFDDGLPQPFKNIIIGGSDNSYTDFGSLQLDDSDVWGWTSGSFHAKLNKNWMVKMNVWSDNFDYFEENLTPEKVARFDDESFSGNGDGYTDFINFYLIEEDDYISLDIDGIADNGVATFKLVIEGVNYAISNPPDSDNEAKVWLKEVWHWNPSFATIAYMPDTGTDPIVCPDGWTLNEATQQCEMTYPECDEGYTYNPTTQQCEINYTPPNQYCDDGYTWNNTLQMCVLNSNEYTGEDYSIVLVGGAIAAIIFLAFKVVQS